MSAKSPKTIQDEWVTIHFKENSIPSLRGGPLTQESIEAIKAGLLAEMPKYMAEERYDEALFDCIQAIERYFGGKDD